MKEKMIARINKQIEKMAKDFERTHQFNENDNAKVDGMMEMLELVTGKEYFYDESGVHER